MMTKLKLFLLVLVFVVLIQTSAHEKYNCQSLPGRIETDLLLLLQLYPTVNLFPPVTEMLVV